MQATVSADDTYLFDDGLIISTTDTKGVITHINRKFCEISGYTKDELKGQNHNIIRHKDMPKAAFENLWKTIHSGKEWTGVIKNMRKDGKYYWVYAHIAPLLSEGKIYGFTAAKRPALSNEIEEIAPLYFEMLQKENNQKAI